MTLRNHKIYALRSVDYESIDYTYVTTEAEAKRVLDAQQAILQHLGDHVELPAGRQFDDYVEITVLGRLPDLVQHWYAEYTERWVQDDEICGDPVEPRYWGAPDRTGWHLEPQPIEVHLVAVDFDRSAHYADATTWLRQSDTVARYGRNIGRNGFTQQEALDAVNLAVAVMQASDP